MGLPEPQVNHTPSKPTPRSRRQPLTLPRRALLLAAGLFLGALLAFSQGQGTRLGPASPLSPHSVLQSLAGASDEARMLFSATAVEPSRSPDLLPAGLPLIYAFYRIPGVKPGEVPKARWSKNGVTKGQIPAASITAGTHPGTGTIVLRAPTGGFGPGVYEVELELGPNKVTASVVTAHGAEAIIAQPAPKDAEVVIPKVAFTAEVDAQGQPQHPRKTFYGTDRIYFAFRYTQAEPGSTVKVNWYGGETAIASAEREVLLPSVEGWAHAWLQAPPPGLPPGEYRTTVTMSADTRAIATGSFAIGEGAAPVPPSSS
ncbi:MAG: hypothetical protein ACYC63_14810 [Armatimonadota bacterium]